jgi:hypothetical protein
VTRVVLQRTSVVAVISKFVAAGVSQHMRVNGGTS